MRIQKYNRKQFVYKEGDEVDDLFIVVEGEFIESKKVIIREDYKGEKKVGDTQTLANSKVFDGENTATKELVPPKSPLKNLKDIGKEKIIKLNCYGKDQLFGQNEIVYYKGIRESSVQCVSLGGIIYSISKGIFHLAVSGKQIEEDMKKKVQENAEKAKHKIEIITSNEKINLPLIKKAKPQWKYKPLTEEERAKIRQKVKRFLDKDLIKKIKKRYPLFTFDASYQFYNSKVIRKKRSQ